VKEEKISRFLKELFTKQNVSIIWSIFQYKKKLGRNSFLFVFIIGIKLIMLDLASHKYCFISILVINSIFCYLLLLKNSCTSCPMTRNERNSSMTCLHSCKKEVRHIISKLKLNSAKPSKIISFIFLKNLFQARRSTAYRSWRSTCSISTSSTS
jgi:hypothetical protein